MSRRGRAGNIPPARAVGVKVIEPPPDPAMQDQVMEFPCDFPIKMLGRDQPGFREAALGVVARHAGEIAEENVRVSSSRRGNFLSITVTIRATSRGQLDAIYRDLTAHEQVLVAL